MSELRTEFPFVLPKGWLDAKGVLHREGTMRLATARDELEPLRESTIIDPDDPYLTVVVLSRVITRLGARDRVTPRDLENLFAGDLAHLQDVYGVINYGSPDELARLLAPAAAPSTPAPLSLAPEPPAALQAFGVPSVAASPSSPEPAPADITAPTERPAESPAPNPTQAENPSQTATAPPAPAPASAEETNHAEPETPRTSTPVSDAARQLIGRDGASTRRDAWSQPPTVANSSGEADAGARATEARITADAQRATADPAVVEMPRPSRRGRIEEIGRSSLYRGGGG